MMNLIMCKELSPEVCHGLVQAKATDMPKGR